MNSLLCLNSSHYSDSLTHSVTITRCALLLALFFTVSHVSADNNYTETPATYLNRLKTLQPGDHLQLLPGEYKNGLPIHHLYGSAKSNITISGPEHKPYAVFSARPGHNTVSIINSRFVTIRHLQIDGHNLPVDAVKCEGHADWAHDITLADLRITGHGHNQQIVGISTKCPTWNWVIRNNIIDGAGTGMYLGNSDGRAPFIAGVIENNLVKDTIGYNLQIKHQQPRPVLPGMPRRPTETIIRHNVFSKAKTHTNTAPRPNVLVGHWPLSGTGKQDRYLIYGNFFYHNTSESLLQGEGNLAIYNNLFINPYGDAIRIQPHHDIPRNVAVFFNTILAADTGIFHAGIHQHKLPTPWIAGNAVFAKRPLAAHQNSLHSNVTDTYQAAENYLQAPFKPLGALNLAPQPHKLELTDLDLVPMQAYQAWNLDFAGRSGIRRAGAYTQDSKLKWLPQLAIKPFSIP